jgi:hypothetical protein
MIKAITILGSVGLFLSSHATAADHEASIAIGSFTNTDNQYSLYNNSDNMVSWGLRGGYAVHKLKSIHMQRTNTLHISSRHIHRISSVSVLKRT